MWDSGLLLGLCDGGHQTVQNGSLLFLHALRLVGLCTPSLFDSQLRVYQILFTFDGVTSMSFRMLSSFRKSFSSHGTGRPRRRTCSRLRQCTRRVRYQDEPKRCLYSIICVELSGNTCELGILCHFVKKGARRRSSHISLKVTSEALWVGAGAGLPLRGFQCRHFFARRRRSWRG